MFGTSKLPNISRGISLPSCKCYSNFHILFSYLWKICSQNGLFLQSWGTQFSPSAPNMVVSQQEGQLRIFFRIFQNQRVSSLIAIVRYANRYFNSVEIYPLELSCKSRKLAVNKVDGRDTMLVIELCLCAPFSNATLEHFSMR